MLDNTSYWKPWFNNNWVHYGVPGSPSESVFLAVWNEDAIFYYYSGSTQ